VRDSLPSTHGETETEIARMPNISPRNALHSHFLGILVYLVIYDSEQVSLEHLLLSWYPSQSQKDLHISPTNALHTHTTPRGAGVRGTNELSQGVMNRANNLSHEVTNA